MAHGFHALRLPPARGPAALGAVRLTGAFGSLACVAASGSIDGSGIETPRITASAEMACDVLG